MTIRNISCMLLAATLCLTGLPSFATAAAKKKAAPAPQSGGRAAISKVCRDPYLGAITVDAATGKVLFEDHADEKGYPASMIKLMDFLIMIEKIEKGTLKLDDKITVSAEISKIGGSEVYLKENEVFAVDDLLYAMMVKSANDAAAALAYHVSGSKDAFVQLMNARAAELGMKSTKFASVHGLPPEKNQEPDVSTARDMTLLCLELIKHPAVFRYTTVRKRTFREKPLLIIETHNHLLGTLQGCDGLKTGYFTAAGFSIAATANRNDRRVISVIMGSTDRKVRDAKACELINTGFTKLPPLPPPVPVITNTVPVVTNQVAKAPVKEESAGSKKSKTRLALYIGLPILAIAVGIRLFTLSNITRN